MPLESPASVLYDDNGIALAVSGGVAVPVSTSALLFAGMTTSGTASVAKMESDGTVWVTGSLSTTVAFPALQNVYVTNTLTSSVNSAQIVNQGLSGSIAQSWYVSLTDGTQIIGSGSAAPIWISGAVTANINNFPATQSVLIVGPITQSVSGSAVLTREASNYTAFVSAAAPTTASFTLLTANTNRVGVIVYNNVNKALYLRFGTSAASSTNFTVKLSSNSYYEVPGWYNGAITAVWEPNGTGSALVTTISP